MHKTTKKDAASTPMKNTTPAKTSKRTKPVATKLESTKSSDSEIPVKSNTKMTAVAPTKRATSNATKSDDGTTASKPAKRAAVKEPEVARNRKDPVRGDASFVATPVEPKPSADDIAERAYRLFVERGCQHGRDLEDWLDAERQLAAM